MKRSSSRKVYSEQGNPPAKFWEHPRQNEKNIEKSSWGGEGMGIPSPPPPHLDFRKRQKVRGVDDIWKVFVDVTLINLVDVWYPSSLRRTMEPDASSRPSPIELTTLDALDDLSPENSSSSYRHSTIIFPLTEQNEIQQKQR